MIFFFDKNLSLYIQMWPVFQTKAYFYIIAIFKLLGFHHFRTFSFLIPSRVLRFAPQNEVEFWKELKVIGNQAREMSKLSDRNCDGT